MTKKFTVYALLVVAVALLLVSVSVTPQADAATVIGKQSVTMLDGSTAYTTTTYTSAYLAGVFGEVVLQVNNDVSGTNTITITPQFSSETVCSSASDWVDASISQVYVAESSSATISTSTVSTNTITSTTTSTGGTTGLTFDTVDVQITVTGDDAEMVRFATGGNCLRVKVETATTFTPTLYGWMVNTQ